MEDGREGGNVEFEDGVSQQYEDEVSHMMRRLRLNFYRAEDMMFIMRKREWAKEDEEFAKEQKRRAKEKRERMIKKNKARRLKKESENAVSLYSIASNRHDERKQKNEDEKEKALSMKLLALLTCPLCKAKMLPPEEIFQCEDGHILCKACRFKEENTKCFKCDKKLTGRNQPMERIAKSLSIKSD